MLDHTSTPSHDKLRICLSVVILAGASALWLYLLAFGDDIVNSSSSSLVMDMLAMLNKYAPWALPAGLMVLTVLFIKDVRRSERARTPEPTRANASPGPPQGKPAMNSFLKGAFFMVLGLSTTALAFLVIGLLLLWLVIKVMTQAGGLH